MCYSAQIERDWRSYLRAAILSLGVLLIDGCVTDRQSVDELGVHVGSELTSEAEGVAIPCIAWQQGDSINKHFPPNALCFTDQQHAGIIYPATPKYPAGTKFKVAFIKRINRFDSEEFFIYAHAQGSTQLLAFRDWDMREFFGLEWHAKPRPSS